MFQLSDSENHQLIIDQYEFLQRALKQLHKGDPRLLDDSIKAFLNDSKVQELLIELEPLKEKLHDLWVQMGYAQPPLEIGEIPEQVHNESEDFELLEVSETQPELKDSTKAQVDKSIQVPQDELTEEVEKDSSIQTPLDEDSHEVEGENPNQNLQGEKSGEVEDERLQLSEDEVEEPDSEHHEESGQNHDAGEKEEGNPPPIPQTKAAAIEENFHQEEEDKVLIPKRIKLDLQNGRVKSPFHYSIPLDRLSIRAELITQVETNGFRESGLELDQENWAIVGVPLQQGPLELKVHIEFDTVDGRRGLIYLEGACTINPDPRSLWQEIEPPKDALFQKSHTDVDWLDAHGRTLMGASRRGRSHAHKGDFRDDDFHISHETESGWYILAVADGAGSAKYSREGSRLACEVTANKLKTMLDAKFSQSIEENVGLLNQENHDQVVDHLKFQLYDTLIGSVFESYKAILTEADQQKAKQRDFATTFLVTIARKFSAGWFVAAYWVGDGSIGIYQKGKSIRLMGSPDGGEFAGQTRFMTMKELWQDSNSIMERIQVALVDDFTALILMTDGISDPKIQTDYNMQQVSKWDELWTDLSQEVQFDKENSEAGNQLLEWLNFWSQGDHDDRTIAIMY